MNVGILSFSSVCERKFLPALLKIKNINQITIGTSKDINDYDNVQFLSYDNFFERSYDWVYISSIPSRNFDLSIKCLKKGWNVICEKPSFVENDNFSYLVDLVKEKKLLFIENYTHTHHPRYRKLNNYLNKHSDLIKHIDLKFFYPGPKDLKNFRYFHALGGGVQFDSLGYLIDSLLHFNIIDKNIDFNISYTKKNKCVNFVNINALKDDIFITMSTGIDLQYEASINLSGHNFKISMERAFAIDDNSNSLIKIETGFEIKEEVVEPSDQFENFINKFIGELNEKNYLHWIDIYEKRSIILNKLYQKIK
tara:strand:+ start:15748 stop:16674 length:927 start_codon:yes stop_codon:yes gene_type:complete